MSSVATVARALLYLRVTSLVGRIHSRLKRLRQPKYMAGALVGIAYVYFFFVRRANMPRRAGPPISREHADFLPDVLPLVAGGAALALLLLLVGSWLIPRRAALSFSEAEIAFLFPAPVSRRMLVHYRLLSSQLGLAFTALVLTLIFGRGNALGGNPAMHGVGWWVILTTLNLHFTGSSFVLARLMNRTLTSFRRKATTLALVAVSALAVVAWAWGTLRTPNADDFDSAASAARYASTQLDSGPLPWLLAIPRLIIAPYLAPDLRAFVIALGPALLVLVMHYFWVLHSEVSFEEASIAKAEKRAARVRAIQQGDWRTQGSARRAQRPPFTLADVGRPEVAFLWKNLLSTSGVCRPRGLLIAATLIIAASFWLTHAPPFERARMMIIGPTIGLLAFALLFGPHVARQDLRSDLLNSDILKTYPLRGWQIVAGELLTPVTILSGAIWLALLSAALNLSELHIDWLTPSLRWAAIAGLAVLAPPFCALQLLVPNAVAVVFPAWAQLVANRSENGLDVMGQRIIFIAGQLTIAALALLPAGIGAAIVFAIVQWLIGPLVGAAFAVLLMFVVLATEVWLGIRWLGDRFERFDLSAELRP